MPTPPIKQDDAPSSADEVAPVPDEAGPHDVPDEQVIEHTLPSKKRDGADSPR